MNTGAYFATHVASQVKAALEALPFIDIHTHLFAPEFGALGLWGIDELLTYHYLEAELFRFSPIPPAAYWSLDRTGKADLIWKTLFVENTPISEATRGVVCVLNELKLNPNAPDLREARDFFASQNPSDHITTVLKLAGVDQVVMTNDPLDPQESKLWESRAARDPRFHAALRLDRMLNNPSPKSSAEERKFLDMWCDRMQPRYMAVSLPDTFMYPEQSTLSEMLSKAVLPLCRERDIPLSLMIGVRRQVNPALRLAGDASGRANLRALENLCYEFPGNKFLVSVLSRENQHELCVYARKFRNLLPFGCWWFLNNPSIVEEITRERIEMLGFSFIPQHSDARVLEQLIYKWRNTRRTLAPILTHSYELLAAGGRAATPEQIKHDVAQLFRANFQTWTNHGDDPDHR